MLWFDSYKPTGDEEGLEMNRGIETRTADKEEKKIASDSKMFDGKLFIISLKKKERDGREERRRVVSQRKSCSLRTVQGPAQTQLDR